MNEQVRHRAEMAIAYYAQKPDRIDERLAELDREWDIERVLETNASSLMLASTAMGILAGRKWLLLSGVVGGFLLQHAVQGWCPPIEVLRRLGVRTQREIDEERCALMALRGDFDGIREGEGDAVDRADRALRLARGDGPRSGVDAPAASQSSGESEAPSPEAARQDEG